MTCRAKLVRWFMGFVAGRLASWLSFEPLVALMMLIAAFVLFVKTYQVKAEKQKDQSFWKWLRQLIESGATAFVFLALLWAFRAILNNNYHTFTGSHGRMSEVNYESVQNIWGPPLVQRELSVAHYVKKREKVEIPREDSSKPPLFKFEVQDVLVEQNSITGSTGEIRLKPNERKKGSAFYNGFETTFRMEYDIVNDSPETTDARFSFPLSQGQLMFEQFKAVADGADLSRSLRFQADERNEGKISVMWSRRMKPQQRSKIVISYKSRGVEHFYYQIPFVREVNNFKLTLIAEGLPTDKLNYPDGCITPTKIEKTTEGNGSILHWDLDRAVTTAGMGIALPKPEQPGAKVSLVLKNSPLALMFLLTSLCLCLMILGEEIRVLQVALLAAAYSLLFLSMAAFSDFVLGFIGSLVIGNALTLGLSYLLYRRLTPFLRNISFALVGFFTLIYPLAGLFPDYEVTFNNMVHIAVIVFLFTMALIRHGRPAR